MIACVRVPHFAAALAVRDDPRLEELPLALVEQDGAAQSVVAVSREAEQAGVRAGMTIRQAQAACDAVHLVAANPARTRRAFDALLEALAGFSDRVEAEDGLLRAAPDRRRLRPAIGGDELSAIGYADLGRLHRDEGLEMACALHAAVREASGLDAAIGLAGGKFTARVAASALAAREVSAVPRGKEAGFLAPFPARLLPLYPEQARQLDLLGLRTLGDLAALPAGAMLDLFGRQGRTYHRLAQGRDRSPVQPYSPPLVERASRELDGAVAEQAVVENAIQVLAGMLAARLEREGHAAREVGLALALEDGTARRAEVTLRQPGSSAARMARACLDLLDGMRLARGVVGVEVTLGGIVVAEARQLALFELEHTPQEALRAVLRDLIARHGGETFYWADLSNPAARLPERRFRLRQVEET